jgi:peptidyl-dipeptidase A
MKSALWMLCWTVLLFVAGCGRNPTERRVQRFIDNHVAALSPLMKESALAYWSAATTGDSAEYNRYIKADYRVRHAYSNPFEYRQLGEWKASGKITDPLLARQLDVLLNAYLPNQVEKDQLREIVTLAARTEERFSTFRGKAGGREMSSNEIAGILKSSTDPKLREEAWLASKQVGPIVAPDIIRLVKMRNRAAMKLGFDNWYTLSMKAGEQDAAVISGIFGDLDRLTEEPYRALKAEIDSILAARQGVRQDAIRPWSYHDAFFQESPQVYEVKLDRYYAGRDVKTIASDYFSGIGLPVDAIFEQSDLFERKGKNPHAFSSDIDRQGDVRLLCNLKNDEYWMETMLHELGHGVYDLYRNPGTPFLLREPSHPFTTEGIANFFGRLSRNAGWMKAMLGLSEDEAAKIRGVTVRYARMKQLIFARWSLVMFNFERELYANPDQDLNALWWNLVEKYQFVKKPAGRNAPDWAAKIHFVMAPCYYHNYLLGELFASQVRHALAESIPGLKQDSDPAFTGDKRIGRFLKSKIFEEAKILPWNEMIAGATGEPLNPKYFVEEFVK